jgi:uncharacterized protein (TIGR03435 family)
MIGKRLAAFVLACGAAVVISSPGLHGCTAFCATTKDGAVLVGNNEDWFNRHTKIHFIPAAAGAYGRMFVTFDDLYPQGGMNERGLWFDGFSTPPVRPDTTLPSYSGEIVLDAMAKCATVEEVVRLFSQYNRAFLREATLMFADASGDAASIEADAIVRIVRKKGAHFVQTNFHQSRAAATPDERFTTATEMLDRAGNVATVELFRDILSATHQGGSAPTQYSNVYDLRARTMYLYYFHDYSRVVTLRLDDELKKGDRIVDIPSLFPPNAAAEQFAKTRPTPEAGAPAAVVLTGFLAVIAAVLGVAVYVFIGVSRRGRITLATVVVLAAAAIGVGLFTVHSARNSTVPWIEFSIGPASGRSASIQPTLMRADGITLRRAISTAYDIPMVRIIGPEWLDQTRYAITAVADARDARAFKAYLKEELDARLNLSTHVERRMFDVFILHAPSSPRLEHAPRRPSTVLHDRDMELGGVSMEDLALALQLVLGRSVLDETRIAGTYNMRLEWGEDRTATLTAALRDEFGLQLTAESREMDALIVDSVNPDTSLVLLDHVGRMSRSAPQVVRAHLARWLTIR